MERSFSEALKQRRTYYLITSRLPIPDQEIGYTVNMTVRRVPSAFNSQSTRVVLLLREPHKKSWQIMKDVLKKIVPAEAFIKTEERIDHSFVCGYGTILFFEDQEVVKRLREAFPAYQENLPGWPLQTLAMHQLVIWAMLEDVGFKTSPQHYDLLVDEEVRRTQDLLEHWHLIAEMPFGPPLDKLGEKKSQPLEERVGIFKQIGNEK